MVELVRRDRRLTAQHDPGELLRGVPDQFGWQINKKPLSQFNFLNMADTINQSLAHHPREEPNPTLKPSDFQLKYSARTSDSIICDL